MFDEVNNQAAPQTNGQPDSQVNPINSSTPTASSTQPTASEPVVQDIFASVESAVPAAPINSQPFGQMPTSSNSTAPAMAAAAASNKNNIAKIVLISLAGLVVIAGGALVYLQYFAVPQTEVVTPEPIISQIENNNAATEATSGEPVLMEVASTSPDGSSVLVPTSSEIIEPTNGEPAIIDATITTEMGATSPAEVTGEQPATPALVETPANLDSDQDGLTDADELNVYGTNPLKADSDGDGYTDGDEIKGGYNPLGEGKLVR